LIPGRLLFFRLIQRLPLIAAYSKMMVALVKETRSEAAVMVSTLKPRWAYEPGWQAYAIAGLAVAAAILVRWFLSAVLSENVPFITFFLAVVIAAWYGGTRPALAASVASLLLAWYLFVPPQNSFAIEHLSDAVSYSLHLFARSSQYLAAG
jgi:K+-sensing histidine kinase KdpD